MSGGPAVVNNDSGSGDQAMPALSVGRDGSVTVAWLDNRNDANNYNYDVYLAHATDGVNFSNNQRVTSVSSNPDNDWRTGGTMRSAVAHSQPARAWPIPCGPIPAMAMRTSSRRLRCRSSPPCANRPAGLRPR